MSHQTDWIFYKQLIEFLIFVAGKCNKIFLLGSFKWSLDTFVFLAQVVAIKIDVSVTLIHRSSHGTARSYSVATIAVK